MTKLQTTETQQQQHRKHSYAAYNSAEEGDAGDEGTGYGVSEEGGAENNNATYDSVDFDAMAYPGGAAGGGSGHIKPIKPTFAGEGNNIFEISTLAQKFVDSFLGYCQHARNAQDTRLENLDQCLT